MLNNENIMEDSGPVPEPPRVAWLKITGQDGRAVNGGQGLWPLPTRLASGRWKPGRWTPRRANPRTCVRGYHLTDSEHAHSWLEAAKSDGNYDLCVYEAEGDGASDYDESKTAFERARLLRLLIGPNEWWNLVADFFEYPIPLLESVDLSVAAKARATVDAMRAIKSVDDAGELYVTLKAWVDPIVFSSTGDTHDYLRLLHRVANDCTEDAYGPASLVLDRSWEMRGWMSRFSDRVDWDKTDSADIHIDGRFYALLNGSTLEPSVQVVLKTPAMVD